MDYWCNPKLCLSMYLSFLFLSYRVFWFQKNIWLIYFKFPLRIACLVNSLWHCFKHLLESLLFSTLPTQQFSKTGLLPCHMKLLFWAGTFCPLFHSLLCILSSDQSFPDDSHENCGRAQYCLSLSPLTQAEWILRKPWKW